MMYHDIMKLSYMATSKEECMDKVKAELKSALASYKNVTITIDT